MSYEQVSTNDPNCTPADPVSMMGSTPSPSNVDPNAAKRPVKKGADYAARAALNPDNHYPKKTPTARNPITQAQTDAVHQKNREAAKNET
jgi:hypothetical protein